MEDNRFATLLNTLPKTRRFQPEYHRGYKAAISKRPMRCITVWYLRGYIEGIRRRFAFHHNDRDDKIE